MINDIKEFHEKFELTYEGKPTALPIEVARFRMNFMHEELEEYAVAVINKDLEGQLDALVDLVYVALGTAYLQGLPFQAAWDEVHACNMRKVKAGPNGEGSKRGSKHDVVKPLDWVGPDYSKIL
jgi:predicted HAD superfamily Cof-like phosphohydrolase